MFERLIAYHILELLKKSLEEIIQRSERIRFADDFLSSNEGVILLDLHEIIGCRRERKEFG